MKDVNQKNKAIGLKPPSKVTINLYSLLAILIIIIPEYMAELLLALRNKSNYYGLDESNDSWEKNPELRISRMSIKGLRELARSLKIEEYARDNRKILSKRLLKKLSRD